MESITVIKKFNEFLVESGRSDSIFWLFKENCFITSDTIYLTFDSMINVLEQFVFPIHNKALSKGIGIQYTCIGEFNGLSLCYPWVPKDKAEMEQCWIPLDCKFTALQYPMNIKYSSKKSSFVLKKIFKKAAPMMSAIPSKALG